MILTTTKKLVEQFSLLSINYLKPERPGNATGLSGQVYDQVRRDFMVVSPLVLHSGIPELLAATWSLVRETLIAGYVDRAQKEKIAWAISKSNQCPYCVQAHSAAIREKGEKDGALIKWSEATSDASHPDLAVFPFETNSSAEYMGTLVAFHYINRMVSVFLDTKLIPVPDVMNGVASSMAEYMMGAIITNNATQKAGESLPLLPACINELAWCPEWARDAVSVEAAISGWTSTVESVAQQRLDPVLIHEVGLEIDAWTGGNQSSENARARVHDRLDASLHSSSDLALMTVYEPFKITDRNIRDAVKDNLDDNELLALVAWASQRAARRSAEWTYARGNSE